MQNDKNNKHENDRMDDVLVEEMEEQNIVRTEDNMGDRMDVGMNPEEAMIEADEGMPELPDHGKENLHDSKEYGDLDSVDVTDELRHLDEQNQVSEQDDYSPESLQNMSQDERHEMQQDANNVAQGNDDEIKKLAGDRRGLRQDS